MTQFNFGNLGSPLSGAALVDSVLEPWRDALHSSHAGSSRPSYATAPMLWINNAVNPWVLNIFDGSQDIPLGTINTTTNLFSVNSDLTTITGISAFIKTLLDDANATAARATLGIGNPSQGQYRLSKSGANVVLLPQFGNNISINGAQYIIPAGGVSLSATGAAVDTLYNIYCYWDGTALQLEKSTTDHVMDAASGLEIKTGDSARSFVGTAYASAANTWGSAIGDVTSWINSVLALQKKSFYTGALATGSTTMAAATTPANTEGDEYMSLAITPVSANSYLSIEVKAVASLSTSNIISMALFRDATVAALASNAEATITDNSTVNMFIRHEVLSGSKTPTTFKVRLGRDTGGTITFNGRVGTSFHGGVCTSYITITEYAL